MVWLIASGILVVYLAVSYTVVMRALRKNPGPGGLGILTLPFAPVIFPGMMTRRIKAWFKS